MQQEIMAQFIFESMAHVQQRDWFVLLQEQNLLIRFIYRLAEQIMKINESFSFSVELDQSIQGFINACIEMLIQVEIALLQAGMVFRKMYQKEKQTQLTQALATITELMVDITEIYLDIKKNLNCLETPVKSKLFFCLDEGLQEMRERIHGIGKQAQLILL